MLFRSKDKGREGTVLQVKPNERVLVEGINMIKKHVKPNPNKSETGGIIDKEAALHISNIALVNPATGKADRVGIKTLEDNTRVRFFKSDGESVDA